MTGISKLPGRFSETQIDDEIVVMHLDTGEFFSLAGTAAATWRLIDGTRNRSTLIAELASEFEADEREIAVDVDQFLARLREVGLLASI